MLLLIPYFSRNDRKKFFGLAKNFSTLMPGRFPDSSGLTNLGPSTLFNFVDTGAETALVASEPPIMRLLLLLPVLCPNLLLKYVHAFDQVFLDAVVLPKEYLNSHMSLVLLDIFAPR